MHTFQKDRDRAGVYKAVNRFKLNTSHCFQIIQSLQGNIISQFHRISLYNKLIQ